MEELTVVRVGNDRAFFRLETNLEATTTTFSGLGKGERPCKLLNISVGGLSPWRPSSLATKRISPASVVTSTRIPE